MKLSKKTLLGVGITTSPQSEILGFVDEFLSCVSKQGKETSCIVVTPNPEQIVLAQKKETFKTILNSADIALPDGAGVVWALKRIYGMPLMRITGVDFMEELCEYASTHHIPMAFIGSRGGVAEKAFSRLQEKYHGLIGFGQDGPEMDLNLSSDIEKKYRKEVSEKIRKNNCRIVFVGLGAPKQEFFIDAIRHMIPNTIFMSVGGSFDVFAGKIRRAPKSVQHLGFEWLWRLIQEPWRIVRQKALLTFLFLVLRSK